MTLNAMNQCDARTQTRCPDAGAGSRVVDAVDPMISLRSFDVVPMPLDLPTRPDESAGHSFAMPPAAAGPMACQTPLPAATQPGATSGDSGDPLHELPAPDFLEPTDAPKPAPHLQ